MFVEAGSAILKTAVPPDERIGDYDWPVFAQHLDDHGWALLPELLTSGEGAATAWCSRSGTVQSGGVIFHDAK